MQHPAIPHFRRLLPALIVLAAPFVQAQAQIVDNIGTEFFIGFMPNENEEAVSARCRREIRHPHDDSDAISSAHDPL